MKPHTPASQTSGCVVLSVILALYGCRDQLLTMKPLLVVGLVCLAMVCIYGSWRFMHEPEAPIQRVWFYDLNTNELFAGTSNDQAPMASPSGDLSNAGSGTPAGVRALVLKVEGGPPKVLLLMTTDEEKQPGINLVKRPNDAAWQTDSSPVGQQMLQEAQVALSTGEESFPE